MLRRPPVELAVLEVPKWSSRIRCLPAVVMGDLTLVRALGMAKVPSILVTTDPNDIAVRSRYVVGHVVVPGFDDRCGATTAQLLCDHGAHLRQIWRAPLPLFYGTDAQLAFVYRFRRELARDFGFLINEDGLGHALGDKEKFAWLAAARGVPVPRTARGDATDALLSLRPPLVVKPRQKIRWTHLKRDFFGGDAKAKAFGDLQALLSDPTWERHKHELLVQERVVGETEDLVSFHGFVDGSGMLRGSFTGRKIRTYPRVAGESSFIELTCDAQVDAMGREATRRLGLRGVFKIDMMRDRRNGELFVLEVNARYNLWNYLGAKHGVNLPAMAYANILGQDAPSERGPCGAARPYRPRYRWLNFYRDAKALREAPACGVLGILRWAVSLAKGPKLYEAFAWRDPAPFWAWCEQYASARGTSRRRLAKT